jgi:hypothetical protein
MSRLVVAKQKAHTTGIELMAIGIKANKFSILYIVNKRHDIAEHKNQSFK